MIEDDNDHEDDGGDEDKGDGDDDEGDEDDGGDDDLLLEPLCEPPCGGPVRWLRTELSHNLMVMMIRKKIFLKMIKMKNWWRSLPSLQAKPALTPPNLSALLPLLPLKKDHYDAGISYY